MKKDIKELYFKQIEEWLFSINEPGYRAKQIFEWIYPHTKIKNFGVGIYGKKICSFADMKNLPHVLQKKLNDSFTLCLPEIIKRQVSKIDGTIKYLLKLEDNELVETVIIPSGSRTTICLSTQVGCRYGCRFCASGLYGFKRNLKQSEILSQLIIGLKDEGKITNVVFMGIGEPLDNLDNVIGSIKIINDKSAFNIGARKITVSTAGIPEKIKELAKLGLQIELSVSLHAPDNKKRNELMPINRLYPIEKVFEALKEYYEKTKRQITFEYVIIKNINDGKEDAEKLAKLCKGSSFDCKINIIPFSQSKEFLYQRPDENSAIRFRDDLIKAGVPAVIRRSKGVDIEAACGQLRGSPYYS